MKNIIIIGAGGHAKVLRDALDKDTYNISAVVDPIKKLDDELKTITHLKNDDDLLESYNNKDYALVMGMSLIHI